MMMKSHERTVLILLFSANTLATIILVAGLAGIYYTSDPVKFPDYTWLETIYIVMQNLETLAYTIGASAPGKQIHAPSKYFYVGSLINNAVLYRAIVRKSDSRGSSDRPMRGYKDSNEISDGTTVTNNSNSKPWTLHSIRKGSIFKPSAIFTSKGQKSQTDDFTMVSPTSPHLYHDKQRLNSGSGW